MLGRLRMSVKHAMEEYEKLAGDIFGHPRWASVRGPIPWLRDKYDGRTVQRAVEDVVERRMHISEREIGAGGFNSPPGLAVYTVSCLHMHRPRVPVSTAQAAEGRRGRMETQRK